MLKKWLSDYQYQKRIKALQNSPLAELYEPPLLESDSFESNVYFVLDFETTGLNPKQDAVLSAGWMSIENGRAQWGNCEHQLVQHTQAIPDNSVVIHHITEQEAEQGKPMETVFPDLLRRMSGKILVAHYADIEVGFLQQLSKKFYGQTLPILCIDTLQVVFAMKYKNSVYVPHNALNLFALREQYELPRYKAHNARSDAIATAELLMLLSEELNEQNRGGVRQLLAMSGR